MINALCYGPIKSYPAFLAFDYFYLNSSCRCYTSISNWACFAYSSI